MMSMIPPTPSPVKQAKSSDVFLPEQLSLPQIHKISIRNNEIIDILNRYPRNHHFLLYDSQEIIISINYFIEHIIY